VSPDLGTLTLLVTTSSYPTGWRSRLRRRRNEVDFRSGNGTIRFIADRSGSMARRGGRHVTDQPMVNLP
jgi:hypothetical protein